MGTHTSSDASPTSGLTRRISLAKGPTGDQGTAAARQGGSVVLAEHQRADDPVTGERQVFRTGAAFRGGAVEADGVFYAANVNGSGDISERKRFCSSKRKD